MRRPFRLAKPTLTGLVAALLAWATAASPATASSAGGTSAPRAWRLVALGDSLAMPRPWDCTGCIGYPAYYGSAITALTGRPVDVVNAAAPDIGSRDLLASVRHDRALRRSIAGADVVTVTIGHNDTPWVASDDPCDGSDSDEQANWDRYTHACVARTADRMRRNLDAVLDEVTALRAGRPTAIRVTTFHNDTMKDPLAYPPGGDAVSKAVVDTYSRAICAVAARHDVPCADVYHAFNGPRGTTFDLPYVVDDHVHPNVTGQLLIAGVLLGTGLDPLQ